VAELVQHKRGRAADQADDRRGGHWKAKPNAHFYEQARKCEPRRKASRADRDGHRAGNKHEAPISKEPHASLHRQFARTALAL
jgi:hypothetical protein